MFSESYTRRAANTQISRFLLSNSKNKRFIFTKHELLFLSHAPNPTFIFDIYKKNNFLDTHTHAYV